MSDRSIGELRLIEACRQRGCPVCRRVRDESRSHLDALLYEQVTDVDTRRALRASWGLCNWHTWMLLDLDTGVFGASVIYEDLLREAIQRVAHAAARPWRARVRTWLARWRTRGATPAIVVERARRPRCPLCVSAAGTERESLLTMLRLTGKEDPQSASPAVLCLPHAVRAIELAPASPELRALLQRTRDRWQAIRGALRAFIDRHDDRRRGPFTEEEAASYAQAFEVMAGAPGLFGNDLGARDRPGDTRPVPRAP